MSFIASLATAIGTAATSGLVGMGMGAAAAGTAGSVLGGIGAGALTGSALGAGSAALTGGDIGEGAGMGALTGAVTGGISSGLSAAGNAATAAESTVPGQTLSGATQTIGDTTQAVSSPVATQPAAGSANAAFQSASNPALQQTGQIMQSPIGNVGNEAQKSVADVGMFGKAGQAWNSLSPTGQTIGTGIAGLGVKSALDSATAPDAPTSPFEAQKSRYRWAGPNNFRWNPTGYATGGITDLDTYMSNAQNIPNPREVADPEGYGGSSVQMMAGGGISKLIPGGEGVADSLVSSSLPGMIFGWEHASDLPLIGGLFNKPEDIATLTPDEKKKLMGMVTAQPGQIQQPQQMAQGGIANLGGYATGGRPNLLNGAGDGVSDDIPASIAGKQPARLAAGEYVISSRIVSELGNGSTDAGAQRLDEMVKRIQAGRSKTMGKGKEYAKDTKPYKHLPA